MGCGDLVSSYWRTLFKGVRHMTIDKFSLFSFSLISWTCRNFLRFDFVSLLLSRLFLGSNKKQCMLLLLSIWMWLILLVLVLVIKMKLHVSGWFWLLGEVDFDTKSQFLASLDSHSKLKILSYVICLQGAIWNLTMVHKWMILHLVGWIDCQRWFSQIFTLTQIMLV